MFFVSVFALHQPLAYVLFGIWGGVFVIVRHRSNIQRLLNGTKPRIGQKLERAATDLSQFQLHRDDNILPVISINPIIRHLQKSL